MSTSALVILPADLPAMRAVYDQVYKSIYSIAPESRTTAIAATFDTGVPNGEIQDWIDDFLEKITKGDDKNSPMTSPSADVLIPLMANHVKEVKRKADKGRTFDASVANFYNIKLSYKKAGTSELGMAIIGVERTSSEKVLCVRVFHLIATTHSAGPGHGLYVLQMICCRMIATC